MTDSELDVALPFALVLDDHAGPAARIRRERTAAMIEAAMLGFDGAAQAPARRNQLARMLSIAACLLLALAGGAAAARYYFRFGNPPTPQAAERPSLHSTPKARPIAPAPQPTPEPEPEKAAQLTTGVKSPRAAAAEHLAPDDLLQRANRLRAAGQFRQAAQTYAVVCDRFPRSPSAYVARVASAAIELEHLSNPTRARRLFEQALREQPAGALDLEARQGLSVALRDLEDRPAEARALHALVASHPDSPAARRAQVRLREIGSANP